MSGLTIPLDEDLRLLVPIVVQHTESVKAMLQKIGRPIPPPVEALALVDTGATSLCLDHDLGRRLDLPTRSPTKKSVLTVTGSQVSADYFAQLQMKDCPELRANYVRVSAIRFPRLPFNALLGMGALMNWRWRLAPGPKSALIVERPEASPDRDSRREP